MSINLKRDDLFFAIIAFAIVSFFLPFPIFKALQVSFLYNEKLWYLNSFLKFAILATMGETIGLRITKGVYNRPGFGLLPRAIVWGFLGIGIKMSFVIFGAGTPALLVGYFGVDNAIESMKARDIFDAIDKGMGIERFITAFSISTLMNLIFAPVFMTMHKITDTHIISNGGTIGGFLKPIQFHKIFPSLNWFVQWDFVFKRTIPFFWIPAHTITFMLPGEYRIVFAAILGVVLGIFLALAAQKQAK